MKEKISDRRALETLGILAFFSVIFGLVLGVRLLFYVALGFLFIGLFLKKFARLLAAVWLKVALFIGTINTKVLLTIIFYVFLTPISVLFRMLGKSDVVLKKDASFEDKSYFVDREHTYTSLDLEKPW